MKAIKKLFRLFYINHILIKNGLDKVVFSLGLFHTFGFIIYLNPWNWFRKKHFTAGVALRQSLEELGPIFVKFGQALSTRPDILPPEIAFELSKLQDKVPAFPGSEAMAIIESTYKMPLDELFTDIDPIALASASMAQVHVATLKTGEEVVVKILRPNMRHIIEQDLSILYSIATLLDTYWPEAKRLKPKEIIQEFELSLINEMDLLREAANGTQLRRNFENSPLLYIPEIYWDYARENIIIMERIHGIPVTDMASLYEHKINIKKLAERGVEIFFTQVFRDSFFHADMHPGNIFVSPNQPQNPQYLCVDFGIIGTLNDEDKRYLAENLFAFFNRDYKRVAQLHVQSGWVAPNTRIEEFEASIRTVCEPIFEKPLKDISFAQLVLRLFQVARRFQMEVQPQLVLLQKTLLAVEGLGRQLYPELDLWSTAKPLLEKWLKEQMGPSTLLHQLKQNIPFFAEQLPHMPKLLFEVLALKKEQLLISKQAQKLNEETLPLSFHWKSSAIGVFATFLSIGMLDYLHLINSNQLSLIAVTGMIVAGLAVVYKR